MTKKKKSLILPIAVLVGIVSLLLVSGALLQYRFNVSNGDFWEAFVNDPTLSRLSVMSFVGCIFGFFSYAILAGKFSHASQMGKAKIILVWIWWWLPLLICYISIPFPEWYIYTMWGIPLAFPWMFLQISLVKGTLE